MRLHVVATALLLGIAGCAQGGGTDAGPMRVDAAGDAGPVRRDAGRDGGGGLPDTGPRDGGGGLPDSGPRDSGPFDSGPPGTDAGRDAGGSGFCPPTAASVEISEVMVASQTGSGDRGEWFELHNLTGCTIDLSGMEIESGTTHTVTSAILTAGGFAVLAQSADSVENHNISEDYAYGTTLRFSNSAGTLVLRHSGTEVARVAWGSTDHRTSSSRQLSNGATMSTSLGASVWCDSTAVYSMTGGTFLGTPGMLNSSCP